MQPSDLPIEERTPCEIWTRVMGYHRPVHAFNAGKRAEHAERRHFLEPAALGSAGLRPALGHQVSRLGHAHA